MTYGGGIFVAVAKYGVAGSRVMTSPDGITWTARNAAADILWNSVTYGNGLFVAVGSSGNINSVMTSPDGINWTLREQSTSAIWRSWESVTYGEGLFVAVSSNAAALDIGIGDHVMTSPDGVTWTSRGTPSQNWMAVTYGDGQFVAVGIVGSGKRVMTSPDGITWTSRTSAADKQWQSVTYGNGLFVAVANYAPSSGSGGLVMTSPDGITWTSRNATGDHGWFSVTFGDGLFVAVSYSPGTGNQVMTSPDGVNWTSRTSAADNSWTSVTYGDGLFVAVAESGTGNRVMTSGTFIPPPPPPPPPTEPPATEPPASFDIDLPLMRPPSRFIIDGLPDGSSQLLGGSQVSPGESITLRLRGFRPGEYVQLIITPPVRVIGVGYADARGVVSLTGTMPFDLDSDDLALAAYAPVSEVGFRQVIVIDPDSLPLTGTDGRESNLAIALVAVMFGAGLRMIVRRMSAARPEST